MPLCIHIDYINAVTSNTYHNLYEYIRSSFLEKNKKVLANEKSICNYEALPS